MWDIFSGCMETCCYPSWSYFKWKYSKALIQYLSFLGKRINLKRLFVTLFMICVTSCSNCFYCLENIFGSAMRFQFVSRVFTRYESRLIFLICYRTSSFLIDLSYNIRFDIMRFLSEFYIRFRFCFVFLSIII